MLLIFIIGLLFGGVPSLIIAIIGIIEGIKYLSLTDDEFYQTYEIGKKEWF
jgi:hypothetical protein